MKTPFRLETSFSRSNASILWPHKYILKGVFYLESFRTRLVQLSRLLVLRLLLNDFYFAHNSSNNQAYFKPSLCIPHLHLGLL